MLTIIGPQGGGPAGGIGTVAVGDGLVVPISASDPEGAKVTGYLQYRPDDDAPWVTVAARISGDVALDSFQSLPASDQGQMRLLVTDGWTTTQALASGIQIPEKGATLGIISTLDGSTHVGGHPLSLEVQALDAEEGFLDGGSVVWTSDVDGTLGTGATLSVDDLSEGDHVLTATATDSVGNESSASVKVTITASDLPDDDVIATLTNIVFASDHGDSSNGFPVVPVGGAVLIAVAVGVVVRRRSTAG